MTDAETTRAALIAELNDLLQLDHDAVQAYDVAIENLESDSLRQALRQFRGDHERHIAELSNLVRANGGTPAEGPHLPTGLFKLVVQQIGRLGGDRGILLAFETNERQARDKYWSRAARPHSAEVRAVLRRAAEDEERHYSWVVESLRRMGTEPTGAPGQVKEIIEQVHSRTADLIEGAERRVKEQVQRLRQRETEPEP